MTEVAQSKLDLHSNATKFMLLFQKTLYRRKPGGVLLPIHINTKTIFFMLFQHSLIYSLTRTYIYTHIYYKH